MFAAMVSELDDAELVSVIQFWERAASAAAAAQLAAIGELARRRPRSSVDGGPAGHSDAGDPLVPEISEFAVDEVAAALRLSRPAAGARLHVAVELTRLRAVATALGNGDLDMPKTRAPSAALADLVRMRDATCRFPGCRQPARRCDLDHVVPWPDGPTTAGNLAAMCRHHHRLKHQTRWTVRAGPDGELLWTSPAGQRYPTFPAA